MTSVFDDKSNLYTVSISKSELVKAFTSESNLQIFLHELVACTYGEALAEELFPLSIHYKLKTK